jgi:hypothetical protein
LLFILNQIRSATEPCTEEPAISLLPSYREDKPDAKEASAPAGYRPAAAVRAMPAPGSLEVIARSRAIEQFGVLFWALLLVGFLMWNFIGGLSTWRQHFLTSIGAQAYNATVPEVWDGNRLDRI